MTTKRNPTAVGRTERRPRRPASMSIREGKVKGRVADRTLRGAPKTLEVTGTARKQQAAHENPRDRLHDLRTANRNVGQASSTKALLAGLDRLPIAFALFDVERRLVAWNAPLAALGLFPNSLLKPGALLAEFQRRDAGLKRRATSPHDLELPTGRVLQVARKRVPPQQLLVLYEDVTDARLAAQRYDLAMRGINESVYDW